MLIDVIRACGFYLLVVVFGVAIAAGMIWLFGGL